MPFGATARTRRSPLAGDAEHLQDARDRRERDGRLAEPALRDLQRDEGGQLEAERAEVDLPAAMPDHPLAFEPLHARVRGVAGDAEPGGQLGDADAGLLDEAAEDLEVEKRGTGHNAQLRRVTRS
ncbi:hypothetical protein LUW74_26940 [Actinomadura madurae]|nr:hypothetical protein [Actinomadura madurae]URN06584.1 hypothetical protein LUW74_26940 [Actinomadura madurae]